MEYIEYFYEIYPEMVKKGEIYFSTKLIAKDAIKKEGVMYFPTYYMGVKVSLRN